VRDQDDVYGIGFALDFGRLYCPAAILGQPRVTV